MVKVTASGRLIEYYTAGTRWGNYTGLLLSDSSPTFHGQPLPRSQKDTKQILNIKYLNTGLSVSPFFWDVALHHWVIGAHCLAKTWLSQLQSSKFPSRHIMGKECSLRSEIKQLVCEMHFTLLKQHLKKAT